MFENPNIQVSSFFDPLNIDSNLIPALDCTFDLGSSTNRWNDGWFCEEVHQRYAFFDGDYDFSSTSGVDVAQINFTGEITTGSGKKENAVSWF